MNNHTAEGSLLAKEFTRRLMQLGMSRRQVTRRSGLSRQTLHNIERGGRIDLKPSTLQALDQTLYWTPGTSLALSQGDASVLDEADALVSADKEGAYRWRIVERIQRMSLTELERMVAIMEGEALGESQPLTTDDVINRVEATIMARLEERWAATTGDVSNDGKSATITGR